MFFLLLILIGFSAQLFSGDAQDLESSLRVVFSDDFGYTLIGEKPASVEQSLSWYLSVNPEKRNRLFNFLKDEFDNSKKFIFKLLNKHGYMELIHKESLLKQICKYEKLSSFIKKKYGSNNAFLKELENPEVDVFDAVDSNSVLLAIVLGYGEENGAFFVRRCVVGDYLKKYPLVSVYPFDGIPMTDKIAEWNPFPYTRLQMVDKPKVLPQFPTLEDEWLWIRQVERRLYKEARPSPPYYISLPTYIARRGPESNAIHERFLKARDTLATLFCGRKFSEVIAEEVRK